MLEQPVFVRGGIAFGDSNPDSFDHVDATVSNYLNTTIDESIRQKYLYVKKNMSKYQRQYRKRACRQGEDDVK